MPSDLEHNVNVGRLCPCKIYASDCIAEGRCLMEKFLDIIVFCVLVLMPISFVVGVWIAVAKGALIMLGGL